MKKIRVLIYILSALLVVSLVLAIFIRSFLLGFLLEALFKTRINYQNYRVEKFKPESGDVAIRFKNFEVFGTLPEREDTLFTADEVFISLNLHNLLFQKVKKADSIYIKNLKANLFVDSLGRKNYRIFPQYDPNRKNQPPEIHLKKVFFENTHIRYFAEGKNKEYLIFYDTTKFSLRIFPHDLKVDLYCNGKLEALRFNSVPFVEDRKVRLDLHFFFDKFNKMMELQKGSYFSLEGIPFFLTGSAGIGALRNYNMQIYAPKATLKTLVDLLPAKVRKLFEPYRIGGEFEILGNYYATHFSEAPAIKLNFQCSEGFIFSKVLNAGIERIRFSGEFSNGEKHSVKTTYLALDSIQAFFGGRPILGAAKFYDLTDIKFQGHLLADLAVKDLLPFLGVPAIPQKTQGEIKIRLKSRETSLAQIQTKKGIDSLQYDGKITFEHIRFALKKLPYSFEEINGNLFFAGQFAKIPSLRFFINGQSFEIKNLYVERPVSYVLGIVPKLKYKVTLEGKKTEIEALLPEKKSQKKAFAPFQALTFLKKLNMDGVVKLRFINFTYKNYFFDKTEFTLNVAKDTFAVPFFALEFPATKIYGNFFMSEARKQKHRFNIALNFKSEDLSLSLRKTLADTSSFYRKIAEKAPVLAGGNLFITGTLNSRSNEIATNIMFYEGFLYGKKLPVSFKGIKFSTELTPQFFKKDKNASVSIRNLQSAINISEQILGGNIILKKVFSENPRLNAKIHSYLDFKELSYILNLDKIVSEPKGKIMFTLNLDGPLKDLLARKYDSLKTSGKVILENIGFKNSGMKFSEINSEIENRETIRLKFLTGKIEEQPFKIIGEIPYFLKFISNPFQEKLIASFDVSMDTLNLNKIHITSEKSEKDPTSVNILLPPKNNLKLRLNVREFYMKKWEIHNFKGKISSEDNYIKAEKISFRTLGGFVKLSAYSRILSSGAFPTRVNFNLKNLNIRKLFYNFDEFNQDFFTSRNIEGIVSAKGSFFYVFRKNEPKVNFNKAELSVYNLYVNKGRILNFKPLQSLKIFKKRMENPLFRIYGKNFALNNGKFSIPYLELNSNVTDLFVSGYITTKFKYRYYVTIVNPSYKKRKKTITSPDFSLANFIIEGDPKNIKVIYDLKESWKHFKNFLGKIAG